VVMVDKKELLDKVIYRRWKRGKFATTKFYRNKAYWKFKMFNKVSQLSSFFEPMIGDKREVNIGDFGSGLVSAIGSTWKDVKVNLYPSDILADEYAEILKDKNYKPLFPVEKQDMEKLTYDDNFFDIIHCANALDHCANPFKVIREMNRVLKPGGWIYLTHFNNNAEFHHYKGLHQWGIILEREENPFELVDCRFRSLRSSFMLTECLPGFKNILRDGLVISIYQKPIV